MERLFLADTGHRPRARADGAAARWDLDAGDPGVSVLADKGPAIGVRHPVIRLDPTLGADASLEGGVPRAGLGRRLSVVFRA